MSNPPAETPTGAARALIAWFAGALAFESVHAFASNSYVSAAGYCLGAVIVVTIDYKLKAILAGSPRLVRSLNDVASDARWWAGAAVASLLIISFSQLQWVDLASRWPWIGAALLVIATSAMLLAKRRHSRVLLGQPTLAVLAMHTCRILVRMDALDKDLRFDIDITIHNDDPHDLSIGQVNGKIRFEGKEFPDSPSIIHDNSMNKLPRPEFTITLRQWAPREFATELLRALENGDTIVLMFQTLTIPVSRNDQPEITFRLPIWDGIRIARSAAVIGRVTSVGSILGTAQHISVS
jgi:hypothetical protein